MRLPGAQLPMRGGLALRLRVQVDGRKRLGEEALLSFRTAWQGSRPSQRSAEGSPKPAARRRPGQSSRICLISVHENALSPSVRLSASRLELSPWESPTSRIGTEAGWFVGASRGCFSGTYFPVTECLHRRW